MKSWKFKLGIVGVFALGLVVGVVGTGMFFHYSYSEFSPTRPEQAARHIMGRLSHELNLSDEQKEAIQPIVMDAFTQMRQLRNRLTPEIEALMAKSSERIKQHLTPDQQKLLDIHNAEVLERWKRFAGPGGPPPPPPFGPPAPGARPAR
jgi:Spy/CpxP family protein refolding chaperone